MRGFPRGGVAGSRRSFRPACQATLRSGRMSTTSRSAWVVAERRGYRRGMHLVWVALAVAPFVLVLAGMVTGRVQARSCCAVPAEHDARMRAVADEAGAPR